MRIDFKFRHLSHSDELTEYVTTRIDRLEKHEMKPTRAEFTFSHEKSEERVDIHVRGQDIEIHAHAVAENFFTAVDHALAKIGRQMERKKARVKVHKVS